MKRFAILPAVLLCVSALKAAEMRGIPLAEIKAVKLELPAPQAGKDSAVKCGHVTGEITKLHLLAQTAKSTLFTFAAGEALFAEFTDMWRPILLKFGLTPTTTEYNGKFGILNYESPGGMAVRDFMADALNYDALDPASVNKLQHELLEPLERAGMTPIASFNIKNDAVRPTFNIYYLTRPNENADREIQLRHLMNGNDIDFDVLANAGVKIVKKDSAFSLVYIGKLIGFKSVLATDEASASVKLEQYRKFLAENRKEFIGHKISRLDNPFTSNGTTFNYLLNIYFYQ